MAHAHEKTDSSALRSGPEDHPAWHKLTVPVQDLYNRYGQHGLSAPMWYGKPYHVTPIFSTTRAAVYRRLLGAGVPRRAIEDMLVYEQCWYFETIEDVLAVASLPECVEVRAFHMWQEMYRYRHEPLPYNTRFPDLIPFFPADVYPYAQPGAAYRARVKRKQVLICTFCNPAAPAEIPRLTTHAGAVAAGFCTQCSTFRPMKDAPA